MDPRQLSLPHLTQPVRPPPVSVLLGMDAEYRRRVALGTLPKVAPRERNPGGTAWLPLMRHRFGEWEVEAHFSNSEKAHARGMTRDWVNLVVRRGGVTRRYTIVTEHRLGTKVMGRRVVRGREQACAKYYRDAARRQARRGQFPGHPGLGGGRPPSARARV